MTIINEIFTAYFNIVPPDFFLGVLGLMILDAVFFTIIEKWLI